MASLTQSSVDIRSIRDQKDLDSIVDLERIIWGYGDLDIDARNFLAVSARLTGQILGAFDGDRLIGFSLAFATLPFGRLHSHRVGVHPDYQNCGIGRKLKLAQRDSALELNIPIIQWTFDPLQSRNAYFNLVVLGGIAKTYFPNFYGITSSPLHGGLPTDRLLIEWDVASDRVRHVLAGERKGFGKDFKKIAIPPDIERRSAEAQIRFRNEFQAHLENGYVVTSLQKEGDQHTYILEKL